MKAQFLIHNEAIANNVGVAIRNNWQSMKQQGEVLEVWKEFFKQKFLGCVELPNGKLMANPTHKLNIKECAEFMQKIEAYAVSDLGYMPTTN